MSQSLSHIEASAAMSQSLADKMRRVMPEAEWQLHAPLVEAIGRLKQERGAVILAHNYQTPEIYHGVADVVGDSLKLAEVARNLDAKVIVMAGVYFMAETVKLLNPDKLVLIPDAAAGCSLADSITPEDVRKLRADHPGVPVVTYVNSSAAVKAETDICCTSGNAVKIVESLNAPEVLCIPDEYLAHYIAGQTKTKILTWKGHCEVHERFTPDDIASFRSGTENVVVLAHPECPPDVQKAADFVGSTAQMSAYIQTNKPARVVMITECSMSDNVAIENPATEFVRPCNLCPHMKRITLQNIHDALLHLQTPVTIDPAIAEPARRSVERMLEVGR
jgi:quinolinate synthase